MFTKNQLRRLNEYKCKTCLYLTFSLLSRSSESLKEKRENHQNFISDCSTILINKSEESDNLYEIMMLHSDAIANVTKGNLIARRVNKRLGNNLTFEDIADDVVHDILEEFSVKLKKRLESIDLTEFCNLVMDLVIRKCNFEFSYFTYILINSFQCAIEIQTGGSFAGYDFLNEKIFLDVHNLTRYEAILFIEKFTWCKTSFIADCIKCKYDSKICDELYVLKHASNKDVLRKITHRLEILDFYSTMPALTNNGGGPVRVFDCACYDLMSKETMMFNLGLLLFGDILESNKLLLERRRIMKSNGVVLHLKKPMDGAITILCRESHDKDRDMHYLFLDVGLEDNCHRHFYIDLQNPRVLYSQLLYETDVTILLFFITWLCTKKVLLERIEDEFVRDLINCMTENVDSVDDMVTVEDPKSWNNKILESKKRRRTRSPLSDFEEKIVNIGAHVRKLPNGSHASFEKQQAAKNYCLVLQEGYTLVEGFERKQRVKKIDFS